MYNNHAYEGLAIGAIIAIVFFAVIIALIPTIFYLLTLQNTLKAVSVQNQRMNPGQVWLMLIPLFGTVWHFIIVQRISESIKAEFEMRRLTPKEDRPAYSIGLAMCICACCGIIPFLGGLAGLAALVLWIIYWVRVADYKRQLEQFTQTSATGY